MKFKLRYQAAISLLLCCALLGACSRDPNVRKRRYLESGNKYLQSGNLNAAAIQYQNAIQLDSHYPDAHYQLAQVYLRQGAAIGAYRELSRTIDLQPTNLNAHLDLGNLLLAVHDFKRAQEQATLVLQQDPNNSRGHILMANSDAALEDPTASIREMQTAIELDPQRSKSYLNMGLLQLNAKDASAAEADFKKAVELDPKSVEACVALGNFYAQQRRFPEAEQEFQKGIQIAPKNPAPYAILARLYVFENERPKAEQVLQQAKQAMPDVSEGYRMLGDFYFAIGDRDAAMREYASISALHPKDLRVQKNYIQLLIYAKQLDQAAKLNDAVLKENPKDIDALIYRGQILSAQNKPADASAALDQAIKAAPENPVAHLTQGIVMLQMNNTGRAESELRETIRLRPTMVQAQRMLADLAVQKNDMNSLRETAEAIIKALPKSPDGYVMRAQSELATDQTTAEADLNIAMQDAPNDPRPYIGIGDIRAIQKKYPEAEKMLETALSKDPNSSRAIAALVNVYALEKQQARAVPRIKQQLPLATDRGPLYQLLGSIQAGQGDYQGAEQSLSQAVDLEPTASSPLVSLAAVQRALNKPDEALNTCKQAIQRNPKDLSAYLMAGTIDDGQQRWQDAEQDYQKALQVDPNYAPAANNLAYVMLQHDGDVNVALTYAQTAHRVMPDSPNTSDTLAYAYIKKGNYQLAQDLLTDAVKKDPRSAAIEYHLGLTYVKTFDMDKAKTHLQHALQLKPDNGLADEIRKALASVTG